MKVNRKFAIKIPVYTILIDLGNIEILHNGQWGAVCDDEWDAAEADVVCRQLGYEEGVGKATHSSFFGPARRKR